MTKDEAEQEVLIVAQDWADAMVANDADRIASYMAEEWAIVSERGVSEREQLLGFIRSGELTHSRFEMVGEPRVKVYGESAVLTCRAVNTAHFGGETFEADEWTTDVFVKRGERWLCVLSHITTASPDQDMEENVE
jgi:ketosteroid isomerase-like protein